MRNIISASPFCVMFLASIVLSDLKYFILAGKLQRIEYKKVFEQTACIHNMNSWIYMLKSNLLFLKRKRYLQKPFKGSYTLPTRTSLLSYRVKSVPVLHKNNTKSRGQNIC